MHTRWTRSFGLVAAALLLLIAAGAAAQSPATEKVTLALTTWAGEDESEELQTLVLDQINASQTEFEIVHQPAPADYYTKLQTSLAGGTAADLMWLSQEYIAGYASRGALLDLTDLLGSVDDPAADVAGYFPDVMKTAIYGDRVYGLPWIAQPVVLFYNPALFDAAGVAYPDDTWDWETFQQNATALTKDNDGDGVIDQYGFTANGWPPIQMFIWQAGGEVITPDLATSPVDSPEAIMGEELYASLVYNETCCPSEDTLAEQGFNDMFRAGKVAMFMGGASDTFEDADGNIPDIRASVVPSGPASRTTFAWTASTVAKANVANPELATRALAALTNGIFHWKVVAPHQEFATRELIAAAIPEKWKGQKEPQIDAILAALPDMRSLNVIPRHQEWDDLFWREFQDPLFHGGGTAADLAAAVRPQLEALLAEGD
jgi:multiple sugar transport system substrate-binding protein